MRRHSCVLVVLLSFTTAASSLIGVAASSERNLKPSQIHIAIAGLSSETMAISWTTSIATNESIVEYGTFRDSLKFKAKGTSSTGDQYKFNHYTSGFIHHAVLSKRLIPSTLYYYRCGDPISSVWSDIQSFQSMPEKIITTTKPPAPMEFGIVGDVGQTNYSSETLSYLSSYSSLNAVIHAGDLAYADFDQTRWDSWGNLIQPIASRLPWMVAPGNHEIEPTTSLVPFVAYQARFRMPHRESKARDGNLYYSFNVGYAHFIYLTPYSGTGRASKQFKWLLADLQGLNRTATPWVIAVMHAPWYNSNSAHQSIVEPQRLMKYNMEDVLYKYKIDLVFAGHVHAYERTHSVYKNQVVKDGPRYVTIGDAGNREGIAKQFLNPRPVWSAFRKGRYGYGHLKIMNESHAVFGWHEDSADDRKPIDESWIVRTSDDRVIKTEEELQVYTAQTSGVFELEVDLEQHRHAMSFQ